MWFRSFSQPTFFRIMAQQIITHCHGSCNWPFPTSTCTLQCPPENGFPQFAVEEVNWTVTNHDYNPILQLCDGPEHWLHIRPYNPAPMLNLTSVEWCWMGANSWNLALTSCRKPSWRTGCLIFTVIVIIFSPIKMFNVYSGLCRL